MARGGSKLTRHKLLSLYVCCHTQQNVKEQRQLWGEKRGGGGIGKELWREERSAIGLLRVAVLHCPVQSMYRHPVEGVCEDQPCS